MMVKELSSLRHDRIHDILLDKSSLRFVDVLSLPLIVLRPAFLYEVRVLALLATTPLLSFPKYTLLNVVMLPESVALLDRTHGLLLALLILG